MYTKSWLIIRDDTKRTFEVVTQNESENSFSNKVIAMQREGMLVTSVILPVTNKNASKNHITLTGYIKETGLYERLLKRHQEINRQNSGEFEE
ncbi:hypothetical protein WSM22_35310 [Cytophagales bacterium WSM2-2]|nr:hypothetical protein WSM22_35310 [Cytophagales bacterium WSM2-2]